MPGQSEMCRQIGGRVGVASLMERSKNSPVWRPVWTDDTSSPPTLGWLWSVLQTTDPFEKVSDLEPDTLYQAPPCFPLSPASHTSLIVAREPRMWTMLHRSTPWICTGHLFLGGKECLAIQLLSRKMYLPSPLPTDHS